MISSQITARLKMALIALRQVERWALRWAPLLVILLGLWSARGLIGTIVSNGPSVGFEYSPPSHGKTTDDDSVRTRDGLNAKPDFASTFAFWVGNWTQGEMGPPTPFGPYFRPLTSQFWWLERAASGGSLRFFLSVHLLWHLAFCLALWATLRLMWDERIALWALAFWTLVVADVFKFSTLEGALVMWKDDPEMTVGLCVLGAMAATWRFGQTRNWRWVALGAFCFALGVAFKESAYVAPFFVALTLWKAGQLRKHWRVVALFLGLALIFYAYRTVVLHGPGGHHGTNASWRQRAFAENIAGWQSINILSGNALGLALSCALLCGILARRKSTRAAWIWGVAGALLLGWSEWNFRVDQGQWGMSLVRLSNVFDWIGTPYQQVPLALAMILLAHYFVTRRPPIMVWGYAWVLAAYLPLLHHAVTSHGFYFHSIGWAIFLAGAALSLARLAMRNLQLIPSPDAPARTD